MADIPQPPTVGKALFDGADPLKAYHALLAPHLDQLRDALGALTLKENLGATVPDPFTVVAGPDGALSGVFVPCSFAPLIVWFRAEELDTQKKPTGLFIGGSPLWSTSPRTSEQGFQVTKAPGLTATKSYAVTFVALAG
jgi:hypothetical protein